ncbi:MAG: acyltransferase family protein [Mogibacterium sp.]|nr:acyltransferase family protein [Mogibacterium sp.]
MPAQTKQRDPYFDNLKGVLIILVAAGHCLNLYRDSNVYCNYLFHLIYAFHMPLFFYISGYFSKNVDKVSRKAFETLIIPAIPFELLYYLMHVVTKADNTQPLLTPVFAYWFCFALFFCRMLLPYLTRIRWIVPVTFALALAAGFNADINEYMTLSRFLCMLPFFMLGYYTTRDRMESIRKMNAALPVILGIAFAAAVFALLRFTGYDLGFTLRAPYSGKEGILFRGFQFLIAVPLSLLVMKLTPQGKSYLSVMGQKTLQIYFLHFYIVTAIKMVNPIADHSLLNFTLMVIAAPVIAAVLSCRPVSKCYDALINAMNKLIIKEGDL